MREDIKTEWVTRLRELDAEGNRQCQSVLRNSNDQMCCLGVLTEIAVEHGVIEPGVLIHGGREYGYDVEDEEAGEDGWYGITPNRVKDWAELPDNNPDVEVLNLFNSGRGITTLAAVNDNGKTFGQIAELIEEQL